ncbi:MAG: hypothetical protein ACRDRK_11775 [Pseudonocardia sp.]
MRLGIAAGADPEALRSGNPIRKPADVAAATAAGVCLFSTDSHEDLLTLAEHAPGATVLVRIEVDDTGSATPSGGKFGCSTTTAGLLRDARRLGLVAGGVSFHAGSQQLDPKAWAREIAATAQVWPTAPMLDLGGGFPVAYDAPVPALGAYAEAVDAAVDEHCPGHRPALAVEPGRFLMAEAGLLHSGSRTATTGAAEAVTMPGRGVPLPGRVIPGTRRRCWSSIVSPRSTPATSRICWPGGASTERQTERIRPQPHLPRIWGQPCCRGRSRRSNFRS